MTGRSLNRPRRDAMARWRAMCDVDVHVSLTHACTGPTTRTAQVRALIAAVTTDDREPEATPTARDRFPKATGMVSGMCGPPCSDVKPCRGGRTGGVRHGRRPRSPDPRLSAPGKGTRLARAHPRRPQVLAARPAVVRSSAAPPLPLTLARRPLDWLRPGTSGEARRHAHRQPMRVRPPLQMF